MDEIVKRKKNLELVTSLSSGYKKSSENFFISCVLSDQVWWSNIKQFLSYFIINSVNLCKPTHDIIKYSTSIYPFESGKYGKKGKKLQKF